MKTQLKMIYAVLIGLGLLTMVAMTVARNPEFDDNDFLKNLKTKLQVFLEGRSPERVYLHFDKPFYKPSETIWFQAYLRQEADLKASQKSDILHIELINPKGNVEKEIQIIQKLVKQRRDAADIYKEQNRLDLYEPEVFQADIISFIASTIWSISPFPIPLLVTKRYSELSQPFILKPLASNSETNFSSEIISSLNLKKTMLMA